MTGINGRRTATQCLSAKCLSFLCVPHPKDVSSELSIELSHYEEQPPSLSPLIHEDEESDEEDEEFPSFYLEAAKSEKLWNHSNFVKKKRKNILACDLTLSELHGLFRSLRAAFHNRRSVCVA